MPIDADEFMASGETAIKRRGSINAADILNTPLSPKAKRNGHTATVKSDTNNPWYGLHQTHPEGGGPYGGRTNAAIKYVGFARYFDMPFEAAIGSFLIWNQQFCSPPLPEDELRKMIGEKYAQWPAGPGPAHTQLPAANAFDVSSSPDAAMQAPPGFGSAPINQFVPMRDRLIDLADVGPPPVDLPVMFGTYLLRGASHWLTGQTGLGKSTVIYNIATALAEGRDLWGITCEQQTILYIDAESGDIVRSFKVERLYRDTARIKGRLFFARLPVKLPEELDQLLEVVKEKGITLVIFDTARRCFTVDDENDNTEVYKKIVPCLDRLKAAGVATLTLGHPAKSGGSGARGAGAQEDAGDINLTLTPHKAGALSDANLVLVLQVTKNRVLGLQPPLYLQRCGNDQFERITPNDGETEQEKDTSSKVDKCKRDIYVLLKRTGEPGLTYGSLEKEMKSLDHSHSTFNRALKDLAADNDIVKAGQNHWTLGQSASAEQAPHPSDDPAAYEPLSMELGNINPRQQPAEYVNPKNCNMVKEAITQLHDDGSEVTLSRVAAVLEGKISRSTLEIVRNHLIESGAITAAIEDTRHEKLTILRLANCK